MFLRTTLHGKRRNTRSLLSTFSTPKRHQIPKPQGPSDEVTLSQVDLLDLLLRREPARGHLRHRPRLHGGAPSGTLWILRACELQLPSLESAVEAQKLPCAMCSWFCWLGLEFRVRV